MNGQEWTIEQAGSGFNFSADRVWDFSDATDAGVRRFEWVLLADQFAVAGEDVSRAQVLEHLGADADGWASATVGSLAMRNAERNVVFEIYPGRGAARSPVDVDEQVRRSVEAWLQAGCPLVAASAR